MSWTKRVVVVVAALVANGCGDECQKLLQNPGEPDLGRFVYDNQCMSCHGSMGQGASAPSLQEQLVAGLTRCEIVETVRTGPGIMPTFDKTLIDEDDMANLVEYITLEFQ